MTAAVLLGNDESLLGFFNWQRTQRRQWLVMGSHCTEVVGRGHVKGGRQAKMEKRFCGNERTGMLELVTSTPRERWC